MGKVSMYYAIKTLESRIVQLKEERERVVAIWDEPELAQDLEWATNDLENIDLQLEQLRSALRIFLSSEVIKDTAPLNCPHTNKTQHWSDVFGYYISCQDCGKDL